MTALTDCAQGEAASTNCASRSVHCVESLPHGAPESPARSTKTSRSGNTAASLSVILILGECSIADDQVTHASLAAGLAGNAGGGGRLFLLHSQAARWPGSP